MARVELPATGAAELQCAAELLAASAPQSSSVPQSSSAPSVKHSSSRSISPSEWPSSEWPQMYCSPLSQTSCSASSTFKRSAAEGTKRQPVGAGRSSEGFHAGGSRGVAPEALLQGLEAQRQARRDQVPQFGLQALRRQLRARRQDARAAAHGVQRLEAGPQRPELASLPELLVRLKLAMPPHARLRRARERVEVLHLRVRRGAGGLEDAEHVDELRRVEVLQLSAEASLLRATCSGNEPSLSESSGTPLHEFVRKANGSQSFFMAVMAFFKPCSVAAAVESSSKSAPGV